MFRAEVAEKVSLTEFFCSWLSNWCHTIKSINQNQHWNIFKCPNDLKTISSFPVTITLNLILYSCHCETVKSGLYHIWFIFSMSICLHGLAPAIITVSFSRTSVINTSNWMVIKLYDFIPSLCKRTCFFSIIAEFNSLHVVLSSLIQKYFSHAMGMYVGLSKMVYLLLEVIQRLAGLVHLGFFI